MPRRAGTAFIVSYNSALMDVSCATNVSGVLADRSGGKAFDGVSACDLPARMAAHPVRNGKQQRFGKLVP